MLSQEHDRSDISIHDIPDHVRVPILKLLQDWMKNDAVYDAYSEDTLEHFEIPLEYQPVIKRFQMRWKKMWRKLWEETYQETYQI